MRLKSAVLLSALLSLTVILPAAATNADTMWHIAHIATLPHGAVGLPQGYLPALSCSAAGYCTAGGAYNDASKNAQGFVLSEVAGVWKAPTKLVAPPGALVNPALTPESVSCGAIGSCVVVGNYQDASNNSQSFLATEVHGVWGPSREISLPANAATTSQTSQLRSVSCASAGNCSAVGSYIDNSQPTGHIEGYVLSEVRDTWSSTLQTKEPTNANTNPYVGFNQIKCGAPGDCTAVGSYIDRNNVTHGVVLDQRGGRWATAMALELPGDANAFPSASLSEVSCATASNCTAIGSYTTDLGAIDGLTVTEARGTWQRAVAMQLPAGVGANPHVFFYGYGGLSCTSIGNCSGGGQYRDAANQYEGFLIDEVNGVWKQANELILPSGARAAGKNGGVVAVSCRRAGVCSAGAAYLDGVGRYQALVVNEVAHRWRTGLKVTLPDRATSVGVDGGVYGLVCSPQGPCTATGSYLDATSAYEGFTLTTG